MAVTYRVVISKSSGKCRYCGEEASKRQITQIYESDLTPKRHLTKGVLELIVLAIEAGDHVDIDRVESR